MHVLFLPMFVLNIRLDQKNSIFVLTKKKERYHSFHNTLTQANQCLRTCDHLTFFFTVQYEYLKM